MITDFASLKASIALWLDRTDLSAQIPEFIQLAEKEIATRLRRTTKRASVTFSTPGFALPADVAELRTVRLATGIPGIDRALIQKSEATISDLRSSLITSGYPRYFSHVGTQLLLVPAPASALPAEISYYEALVALSDSNTTNSVLADSPNVYLFGALELGEQFMENDERSQMWRAKFEDALAKLEIARDNAEWSQSMTQARLPVVF